MKRVIKSISIDKEIWEQFQKLAQEQGRSVSNLIEEFMRKTLDFKKY